jgi:hypothetical protein
MRILRGQSNLEVSSKGFAWFVVGLVLATFLGGALRTVLNSTQMHQRIVAELKNRFPKHEFQIGATEILLSRGIWPGLGLRVRELTFKQDVCGKLSFVLTIPQATLPLDILGLLHGRIRLNDIEIEGGGLHLDYRDCAPKSQAVVSAAGGSSSSPAPTPRPIVVPRVNWREAARFADGIELKNFAVTYEKSPTWKLLFTNAYLSLGDESVVQAQVDVEKSLPFGTLAHPVEFELRADENVVQWNFNAEFKEGHVHVNGSLDMNNQAGLVKVNFRQVPVRDLMGEAFQVGLVDRELKLKATWLSCALKWEGRLQNYSETPVNLRECRVEGGYGRAELDQADLWLNGGEIFKVPAHVKVAQLQLLPLVEALNRQVLPAVLPRLGIWSGALDITGASAWKLDGHLDGTEIIFSSQSLAGKQVIDSLHTQVKRSGAKISVQMDDVHLHEGEFAGSIGLDLSSDWRDGTFHAQIEKLILSPAIQKLLVGGGIGALKLSGQGALSAGELSQWSGNSSLPEISGEGWRAENLQLHSRYQGGAFHVDAAIKTALVDGNWRIYPQLHSIRPNAGEKTAWRDLNAKIEIQKNGGVMHSAVGYELPLGLGWKAKGNWVRDGDFNGTLNVSGGGAKRAQNFILHGEKGALTVENESGTPR